jgi:hypothetical protein
MFVFGPNERFIKSRSDETVERFEDWKFKVGGIRKYRSFLKVWLKKFSLSFVCCTNPNYFDEPFLVLTECQYH